VPALASFVRIELEVLLAALALIVAFQLLTGKINMGGMLLEKTTSGVDGYSAARLQLLLVTLVGAFYLITEVINSIHQGSPHFPTVDEKWLLLLGGSHSIYLGGKVNSLFGLFGNSNTTLNSPKGDLQ
jgi:hypothetical protein